LISLPAAWGNTEHGSNEVRRKPEEKVQGQKNLRDVSDLKNVVKPLPV
jgi:hypothetical protein